MSNNTTESYGNDTDNTSQASNLNMPLLGFRYRRRSQKSLRCNGCRENIGKMKGKIEYYIPLNKKFSEKYASYYLKAKCLKTVNENNIKTFLKIKWKYKTVIVLQKKLNSWVQNESSTRPSRN